MLITILGMPVATVLVFAATIVAGSIGAAHYLVIHKFMGKPFPGQEEDG